jgi:methylated-DNA-[protein]-cysteine S-methyltransferase
LSHCVIPTALGNLIIEETDSCVSLLNLTSEPPSPPTTPFLKQAAQEVFEYLLGKRTSFNFKARPLGTEFQTRVWTELQRIPHGEVRSYKDIALKIGQPNSARAVGTAIGKNPILLCIPCHRVITAQRKLGGFSAGIQNKRILLELEKVYL